MPQAGPFALDAAMHGLVDHEFDAVLTGGIDHNMGAPTFVKFCKIGALSPDGGQRKLLAVVPRPRIAQETLRSLGLPSISPPVAPARCS